MKRRSACKQIVAGAGDVDVVIFGFAVSCSELQRAAMCCSVLLMWMLLFLGLRRGAVCCTVLKCVASYCSVLQRAAVCCSVLQCVVDHVVLGVALGDV